jgi:hypothetical protein
MNRLILIAAGLVIFIPHYSQAATLCPDGTYVGGNSCQLAPDGSYVSGSSSPRLAPDGTYTGGQPRLAPDGTYVGGRGSVTLCPDGSYVNGRCEPAPDGRYVGALADWRFKFEPAPESPCRRIIEHERISYQD